jgi:hypothetical protein
MMTKADVRRRKAGTLLVGRKIHRTVMGRQNRTSQVARRRKLRGSVWFSGLAVLTIVLYAFFAWIVIADAGASRSEAVHVAGALSFFGIVAAGLIPQLVAPTRNVAAFQPAFLAAIAVMALAAIVGNPNNQGGQAGPFDVVYLIFLLPLVVLVLLHPARRELVKVGRVELLLLVMAAALAIPLLVYGVDQALTQRNSWPPKSDPHHNSHWANMAQLAFATPLVAAIAGIGVPGWKVPAWTASVVLAVLGAASVAFPDAASSVGIVWGVLAVLAAAVLMVFLFRGTTDIKQRQRIGM